MRTQRGLGMVPIIVVLVAIVGIVAGLGFTGIVNIPGITPKKTAKANLYGPNDKLDPLKKDSAPSEKPKAKPPKKTSVAKKPISLVDRQKGAEQVAELWNRMPAQRVISDTVAWREPELARIVMAMDPDKAAALVAAMDPKRSAKVVKEVERLASRVNPEP